jgi:hypothetical protein
MLLLILTPELITTVIATLGTVVVSILTYVIAPYIVEHAKKRFSSNSNDDVDIVIKELEGSKVVYDKLESIKNIVNCDKIWIAQFHNGANYLYNAKSMQKFSVKFETCDVGVAQTKEFYQNLPIHLYYRFISAIVENSFLFIDFQDTDAPKYDMDRLRDFYPIKSMYAFPIYSIDDKLIGLLVLEYVNNHSILERKQLDYLLGDIGALGSIIVNNILKKYK